MSRIAKNEFGKHGFRVVFDIALADGRVYQVRAPHRRYHIKVWRNEEGRVQCRILRVTNLHGMELSYSDHGSSRGSGDADLLRDRATDAAAEAFEAGR